MISPRRLPRTLRAVPLIGMLGCAGVVAAEVESVKVDRDGDRYRIQMRSRLSVPPKAAHAVFTRFEDLPAINPSVRRAQVIDDSGATTRVATDLRVCIVLFCPRLKMTQDMRTGADGESYTLTAAVVPEYSDFRYGLGTWAFSPCGQGTCLRFDAELEPDFWIPRLIGTWLMKRELRSQAVATSEGIERLAAEPGEPTR